MTFTLLATPLLTAYEWEALGLSLRVALVAVLVIFPFGVALGYVLARRRTPLRFVIENLVQLPLVLPPVVIGYMLLLLLGPRGPIGGALAAAGLQVAFTWLGAAIAAGIVAFPLLVQTVRVTFEQIDPSWEEAVLVDGGGRWAAFRWVVWPLAARGMAAGLILAFARAVGEFGATIVLAGNIPGQTQTLPLAIFTRLNQLGGDAAALRLVVIAVLLSIASLIAHAWLTRRLHSF